MRTADALYPGLRLRVARRLHHAVAHARSCASEGPARSTAARGVRAPTSAKPSSPRHPSERRAALVVPPARLPHPRARTSGSAGYELDLVVRRGRTVVFCEVKSKAGDGFGDPLEMVTPVKVARVRRAALALARRASRRRPRSRPLRRGRRAGAAALEVVQDAVLARVEPGVMAATQEQLYSGLDLDLSWSERELPERERTKHVHRLHPYLGKYIPQLVEELFRRHVPARRARARPVRRLGHDARPGARERARLDRRRHRRVQLPADAREDARAQPVRRSSASCATRSRASSAARAAPASATPYVREWFAPQARDDLLRFRSLAATTSTPTSCGSSSRAPPARRG